VMCEGLLAVLAFAAAEAYSRYLSGNGWRAGLKFAAFSTLAILTKGNGWALLLLPFFALLFTRRFRWLLRWDFWAPMALIFVLCAPWQLLTAHLVQHGWTGTPGPAYFFNAVVYFARQLWFELNPAICLLALAGMAAALFARGGAAGRPASMAALFASFYVFHGLTPVGLEIRQLLPAIPAVLTFVPAGAAFIAGTLRRHGFRLLARPAAIASVAGLFFAGETFAITPVRSYGFEQAARFLNERGGLKHEVILVSSEAGGEGIAITETEMLDSRPGRYLLRANKLLARADWSGEHYEPAFTSVAAVRDELNLLPASALIIDFTRSERPRQHHQQLLQLLANYPLEWQLAGSFGPDDSETRPVRIYVRGGPYQPSGDHLQSILADELHRIGEQ
jgi:hypothetical protein